MARLDDSTGRGKNEGMGEGKMIFEENPLYYMIKCLIIVGGTLGMMISCTRIKCSWKKMAVVLGLYFLWIGCWSLFMVECYGVLTLLRFCVPTISLPAVLLLYFLSEYSPWQAVFNYTMQISISLIVAMSQTVLVTELGGRESMDFLIRAACFSLCIVIVWKLLREKFALLDYLPDISWRSLTLVPVSFMLLIVFIGTYPVHFMEAMQNVAYLYAVAAIMVIVYIILFRSLFRQYKLQLMELTEVSNNMLKRELALMQKQVEDAQRFRHDLRHHDKMIADYVRKEEIGKLFEYLEQQEKEYSETDFVKICENITVDNILGIYAKEAREKGIYVNLNVVVRKETGIRDTDFIAILGNAMENAVHGCTRSGKEEQRIFVHIRQKGGKLAMRISNTCPSGIVFKDGVPVRKNSIEKGIGIESIQRSVRHYDGEADFKVENDEFVARILLNIPQT